MKILVALGCNLNNVSYGIDEILKARKFVFLPWVSCAQEVLFIHPSFYYNGTSQEMQAYLHRVKDF